MVRRPVSLAARSVVILLRPGPLATAIAAEGLPTAGANRMERQAAGLRRARAAALGIGALAGARFELAPQAGIATEAGPPGAGPANTHRSRGIGSPDQRDQDQRQDDSQCLRQKRLRQK